MAVQYIEALDPDSFLANCAVQAYCVKHSKLHFTPLHWKSLARLLHAQLSNEQKT